jgi:hypothetical protein
MYLLRHSGSKSAAVVVARTRAAPCRASWPEWRKVEGSGFRFSTVGIRIQVLRFRVQEFSV